MLKMVFALSRIGFLVLIIGIAAWGVWRLIRRRLYGDRVGEIERRERALRGRERTLELEKREMELRAQEAAVEAARTFLSERRQQLEDEEYEKLMRMLDGAHPGLRALRGKGRTLTTSEGVRRRLHEMAHADKASDEPSGGVPPMTQEERSGQ